jgi:tetratricopeptide (TPR) repeat protein
LPDPLPPGVRIRYSLSAGAADRRAARRDAPEPVERTAAPSTAVATATGSHENRNSPMTKRIILALCAVAVATACQSDTEAANRTTLGSAEYGGAASGLPAGLQAHIDEGNAAYRAQDYEGALQHYQIAADMDPAQPTAWFGVAMAASAMGDEERAEAARQRVQQLDPALGGADHSTMTVEKPHP